MNNSEIIVDRKPVAIAKLPLLAAIVALVGIIDAFYLSYHHYTAQPVPCSIVEGCEQVLTSRYAEIYGIPLALFGALAYLAAFTLAALAAGGKRRAWTLFGVQITFMMIFTVWLLYLQAYVIEAFCQFCLLSAAATTTLFIIFVISKIVRAGKIFKQVSKNYKLTESAGPEGSFTPALYSPAMLALTIKNSNSFNLMPSAFKLWFSDYRPMPIS